MQILWLLEMIVLELAKYDFKISHLQYPAKIHDIANTNGRLKQHRYPTRHKNIPNIPKHTTTEFNSSYLCKGIKTYNNLSFKLKSIHNLKVFTWEMKNYLLSNYHSWINNQSIVQNALTNIPSWCGNNNHNLTIY